MKNIIVYLGGILIVLLFGSCKSGEIVVKSIDYGQVIPIHQRYLVKTEIGDTLVVVKHEYEQHRQSTYYEVFGFYTGKMPLNEITVRQYNKKLKWNEFRYYIRVIRIE